MIQPSVVAVDLDGTLLRSDGSVSARTAAALERVRACGARVMVVTGRPPRYVSQLAGVDSVAVCSNGAIVYEVAADDCQIVGPLALDAAREAARLIAEVLPQAAYAVETGRRVLIGPGYRRAANPNPERILVRTTEELWSAEGCVKLLAWSPQPVTAQLLERLQTLLPQVTVTYSGGSGLIEISAAGVDKATTLAQLCTSWAVAPAEVIAFGDMPNDLAMLRWAGTSVAVANAHPLVLSSVDRIAASNDHDGVAGVLEELFVVPVR